MSQTMTIKEAAARWNISVRRVTSLCQEGRIPGAKKHGNRWLIPADAERPIDQRITTGAYTKHRRKEALPLPIGISDYRLASTTSIKP